MLELADRLGLDLPHPLPRHLKDPPHFLQGVRVTVPQSVPQPDDLTLSVGERLQQVIDLLAAPPLRGRDQRALAAAVLDDLAEATVLALPDWPVQADRLPADVQHSPRLLHAQLGRPRRLLHARLPSQLLLQLLGDVS